MNPPDEQLLTLDETAKFLRCSRTTVERLIRSGTLRSVKISARRRVVRQADLNDYVREAAAL